MLEVARMGGRSYEVVIGQNPQTEASDRGQDCSRPVSGAARARGRLQTGST